MRRVLVTGASGYLGRSCVPMLVDAGYEVHAVSRNLDKKYSNDCEWHCVDIMDLVHMSELVCSIRPTHCLHLAWYTEHGKFWNSSKNIDWVHASMSLLETFAHNGGQRVVISGSCAEYDWGRGICKENSTLINPSTIYGQCKHELHKKVTELSKLSNLEFAWARLFFLYGKDENVSRLVSSVCNSLLQGNKAKTSSGEQRRDFMHVSDASSALVKTLRSDFVGAVNVASGEAIAIRKLVMLLASLVGRVDLLEIGGLEGVKDEPLLILADTRKLNDEIKFKPSLSIDEGLKQTVDYWKSIIQSQNIHALPDL